MSAASRHSMEYEEQLLMKQEAAEVMFDALVKIRQRLAGRSTGMSDACFLIAVEAIARAEGRRS